MLSGLVRESVLALRMSQRFTGSVRQCGRDKESSKEEGGCGVKIQWVSCSFWKALEANFVLHPKPWVHD